MKLETTRKINVIANAVLLSLFVIVFGAVEANAAMYSDYFTTNTTNTVTSFTSWAGTDTPQACDAYDAVFYSGQCVKAAGSGGGVVLGTTDEAETSVEVIDTRCVAEDGVAELELEQVQLYELKNRSTGDVIAQGGTSANFQTFSSLSDGNYRYTGRGDAGNDKANFTIDCDPDNPPLTPQVSASCVVTPGNPEVGEEVSWEAVATDGDGVYSYSWSGAVSGNDSVEQVSYNSTGEKTGYITVSSDGHVDTARCSVLVTNGDNGGSGDASGGGSDDDDNNSSDDGDDEDDADDTYAFIRTIEEF